jgi:hypothetical protein
MMPQDGRYRPTSWSSHEKRWPMSSIASRKSDPGGVFRHSRFYSRRCGCWNRHLAKLPRTLADVYPVVKTYISERCFGKQIDVDTDEIRSHLHRLGIQEGIAKYLAREISTLTVELKMFEFNRARSDRQRNEGIHKFLTNIGEL